MDSSNSNDAKALKSVEVAELYLESIIQETYGKMVRTEVQCAQAVNDWGMPKNYYLLLRESKVLEQEYDFLSELKNTLGRHKASLGFNNDSAWEHHKILLKTIEALVIKFSENKPELEMPYLKLLTEILNSPGK